MTDIKVENQTLFERLTADGRLSVEDLEALEKQINLLNVKDEFWWDGTYRIVQEDIDLFNSIIRAMNSDGVITVDEAAINYFKDPRHFAFVREVISQNRADAAINIYFLGLLFFSAYEVAKMSPNPVVLTADAVIGIGLVYLFVDDVFCIVSGDFPWLGVPFSMEELDAKTTRRL